MRKMNLTEATVKALEGKLLYEDDEIQDETSNSKIEYLSYKDVISLFQNINDNLDDSNYHIDVDVDPNKSFRSLNIYFNDKKIASTWFRVRNTKLDNNHIGIRKFSATNKEFLNSLLQKYSNDTFVVSGVDTYYIIDKKDLDNLVNDWINAIKDIQTQKDNELQAKRDSKYGNVLDRLETDPEKQKALNDKYEDLLFGEFNFALEEEDMNCKSYRVIDDKTLYWVTQAGYLTNDGKLDRRSASYFRKCMIQYTPFDTAYIVVRDYSTYSFKKDLERDILTVVKR